MPSNPQSLRILITGAGRGLGLGLAEAYARDGHTVIALARNLDQLAELQARYPETVHGVRCDVTDAASVTAAAAAIAERVDGLDLLINNAGVSGDVGSRLGSLDYAKMHEVFDVNVVGPLRMTEAMLPALRQGNEPRVVLMTSRMGSIADNDSGGWWAYRMSKAALNMACRNMMLECREEGIAAMVLHPGWVQTDMGGAGAPLTIEQSVAGMQTVISELSLATTGAFRDFSGATLPW